MIHKRCRIAFVACSLSVALASGACAELRVGVTGGLGVGHMSIDGEFGELKWGGGASLEFPVGQRFGVRSGVYWRPSGSKLASTIPEDNSTTLRFNYVAVPVGIGYRLYSNSRLVLLGLGAMEWSYLVDAHQVIDHKDSGETESEVTDQMQSWDIAPVLGLALATAGGTFELAVQYSWGLRSVYKDSGDLKNRSLWILGTLWVDFP
jgi:hypothetical protein